MLKTAVFMAGATFMAKILGLVRESLITAYFGVGNQVDAYFAASQLPTTLFDMVIGGVISASFIPVFNTIFEKEDREKAFSFANKFVGMILLATFILSAVGIVFSENLITGIIAPGFSGETLNLASTLSKIMFPMVIFTGLAFSFVGILQSFGEFNIPSLMSLVSNLAVILYFPLFGKRFGILGLSVTILISWSLQVLIQIPSLKKFGYKFKPRLDFRDEHIKKSLCLALPMLISTWVQPLYSLVNTRLASNADGVVSVLNCSNRLYLVMTGVFSFVITNLIFPKLSRTNAGNREDETKSVIKGSLKAITLIIVPLMVLFIILSEDIIGIIYEHGKFTHDKTLITASALSMYSVGMIGLAYNEIMSKSFFSMQDSKTPMFSALISMGANILMAYVFYKYIGVSGLALATAGGSLINATLNFIMYRIKRGVFMEKTDILEIVKTFISGIIMAVVVIFISRFIKIYTETNLLGYIIHGIVSGGAGLLVYIVLLWMFDIKTFKTAIGGVISGKK